MRSPARAATAAALLLAPALLLTPAVLSVPAAEGGAIQRTLHPSIKRNAADPVAARADLARPTTPTVSTLRGTARAAAQPITRTSVPAVVLRGTRHRPVGDVATPPVLRARAWVVADLGSGVILGRHRARSRLPQASTIKVLTALTALRRVPSGIAVRATARAATTTCSCAGVVAADTAARNPSGLDAPGAHSTARDLVVLLRAAAQEPPVARWLDVRGVRFGALHTGRHWLSTSTDFVHQHPQSYAAKNGYTSNAGNTLVTATRLRGHRIAVAVLDSPTGHTTTGAWALTRWAARYAQELAPVGRLP